MNQFVWAVSAHEPPGAFRGIIRERRGRGHPRHSSSDRGHPTNANFASLRIVSPVEAGGIRFAYSFDDAKAADRHTTQYFEMFVNRGIYYEGWTACTKHSTPWLLAAKFPKFEDDVWELNAPEDWTQANPAQSREIEAATAALLVGGRQIERVPAR